MSNVYRTKNKKNKLPGFFKPLFWGYLFGSINPVEHKHTIIVNTLNYGDLRHWRWLVKTYGKIALKRMIELIPQSEFRRQVIPLIRLLFDVNKFKYASRGAKIKAERGL